METQLREIARTIERLEKADTSVPDVLRAEKTRLAAALSVRNETVQALNRFVDGIEGLLKELKARLGRNDTPVGNKKIRRTRSRLPKTSYEVLQRYIILALKLKHSNKALI